jgi:hypothetical protein
MNRGIHRQGGIGRALALALIGLALLLRIAMPAGWMPSQGRIGITLCTAYGAVQTTVAIPGLHHGDGHDAPAPQDHPCAFAGIGAPLDIAAVLDAPVFAAVAVAVVAGIAQGGAIGRGLAAPPPPATGPPTIL